MHMHTERQEPSRPSTEHRSGMSLETEARETAQCRLVFNLPSAGGSTCSCGTVPRPAYHATMRQGIDGPPCLFLFCCVAAVYFVVRSACMRMTVGRRAWPPVAQALCGAAGKVRCLVAVPSHGVCGVQGVKTLTHDVCVVCALFLCSPEGHDMACAVKHPLSLVRCGGLMCHASGPPPFFLKGVVSLLRRCSFAATPQRCQQSPPTSITNAV